MASNFFQQLPGLSKFPFGWKKDNLPSSDQHPDEAPPSLTGPASYRARKSISEAHRPALEQRMSMSLINKGLLNPTGENNCFLNSAVQILWHIDVFRRSFRKVKGHACVEKACIFCALRALFNEFQHGGQSAIPPDLLRQAMADCYVEQQRFQLGLMDDAAECFEKILEQIHLHLTGNEDMDSCSVKHCLSHQKFSLTILERTECVCGATSEPLSFVQFVHYISSSAIVKEAAKFAGTSHTPSSSSSAEPSNQGSKVESASGSRDVTTPTSEAVAIPDAPASRPRLNSTSQAHFGKILNLASSFGEYRQCPDYERCKKKVAVKRLLLNCPDVVCLGMIWDSAQPTVDEIMGVVLSIGLTLQLNDLFDHVFSDNAHFNQYELTALIAYYGRHYSTFCYHSKMREWIYFDDAKFRTVGSDWSDVCEVIRKAHYQPLLLVYTNPFAEELDMTEAPQEVTKIRFTKSDKSPHLESISEDTSKTSTQTTTTTTTTNHGATTNSTAKAVPAQKAELEPSKSADKLKSSPGPSRSENPKSSSPLPQAKTQAAAAATKPKAHTPTHTIDPLTLSLVPLSSDKLKAGGGSPHKTTSPVVGDNRASATPTSQGPVPFSAQQLASVNTTTAGEVKGQSSDPDDLMSFSISPAMIEGLMGQGARTESNFGSHLKPLDSAPMLDSSEEDLIKFSIMSPYVAPMSFGTAAMHSSRSASALTGPSSQAGLLMGASGSPGSGGGGGRSVSLAQGLSSLTAGRPLSQVLTSANRSPGIGRSVSPSQGLSTTTGRPQSQVLMGTNRSPGIGRSVSPSQGHSTTMGRPHSQVLTGTNRSPGSGRAVSPSQGQLQSRSRERDRSSHASVAIPTATPISQQRPSPTPSSMQLQASSSGTRPLSNQTRKPEGALYPNWEHFSETSARPSGGAPQKLIQQGGVASKTSAPQAGKSHKQGKEDSSKMWTVVSKIEQPPVATPPGDGGNSASSKAVAQLKRVASQPGFNELEGVGPGLEGGVDVISMSGNNNDSSSGVADNEAFVLQNVFVKGDETLARGDPLDRRFLPLPPTPDQQREQIGQALIAEKEFGFEFTPVSSDVDLAGKDGRSTGRVPDSAALLADLEFAFPTADNLFANSSDLGDASSKVKLHIGEAAPVVGPKGKVLDGGPSASKVKGRRGMKELDYADLDFDPPKPKSSGISPAKKKPVDTSKLDYAEIRPEDFTPPSHQSNSHAPRRGVARKMKPNERNDDYSRLVDVTVERSSEQPIGNDPLYATVDKSRRGAGGRGPVAMGTTGGGGRAGQSDRKSHDKMNDVILSLPPSCRQQLQDAQNLFAQAEASTGSDDTVAMMLYQQFSNLMFKVLQEPAVQGSPVLHKQIKDRRDVGVRRCQDLRNKQSSQLSSAKGTTGSCRRCGQQRSLDDQNLCGPCQLRERKLKQ